MAKVFIMRRFFYDPQIQKLKDQILIIGPEAHHIKKVLRMPLGATAELFDGLGSVVTAQIAQISSGWVNFQVLHRRLEPDTSTPLILAQAMLKGKKMDMLIQKATELGVHSFHPVLSRYCEKQAKAEQQLKRWQRIMLEACKQCRRPIPMQISLPVALQDFPFSDTSKKIMPWEKEAECSFSAADLADKRPVFLLIGPEGGFHPTEIAHARASGCKTVSLGPRILRAETAALAAVTLVQHAVHNFEAFPQPSFSTLQSNPRS
ncbi:MAG: 16S rRNA (uracil(1498)-N(3))-methyltransferase [Candidatus Electrothrix sp. AR3]|nr:16S rRNA (uracil(1498)-N(3))-methyltransferase [Candidatus Electrothrix sp. AR3]